MPIARRGQLRRERSPLFLPSGDLRLEGVDSSLLVMEVAMDREVLQPFPSLDGPDARLEIDGDFFPRPQSVVC